jgi:hypothetical protein
MKVPGNVHGTTTLTGRKSLDADKSDSCTFDRDVEAATQGSQNQYIAPPVQHSVSRSLGGSSSSVGASTRKTAVPVTVGDPLAGMGVARAPTVPALRQL